MRSSTETDLVYVVRPGDDNPELRYSLRSVAANFPHRKVWLCGYRPQWVQGVESIELDPLPDKFDNQNQSLSAACGEDAISDTFVLMNDDFFVMRPIDSVGVLHGPTVREHHQWFIDKGKSPEAPYVVGIRNTLKEMQSWGYEDPLSYELHSPLPVPKARLGKLLERANSRPFLWQSAYAAIAEDQGERGYDAKNDVEPNGGIEKHLELTPFLSSFDYSFAHREVGRVVRAAFPKKCRYEK